MFFDWVSFLVYPNLFGIKGFVVEQLGYLEQGNSCARFCFRSILQFSMEQYG
jgi:hypothetical protein